MADGKGCKCYAYHSGECACDADWTPQEVIDLRKETRKLKELLQHVLATTSWDAMSDKTRQKILKATK